jgi:hypothetical protein
MRRVGQMLLGWKNKRCEMNPRMDKIDWSVEPLTELSHMETRRCIWEDKIKPPALVFFNTRRFMREVLSYHS